MSTQPPPSSYNLASYKRFSFLGNTKQHSTSVTHTHLCEELVEYPHEVTKGQIIVCDHALNLVELGQVSRIQSLVPKHSIDREILDRRELFLLTDLVKHPGADSSGVSAKDVLLSLLELPVVLIAMYIHMYMVYVCHGEERGIIMQLIALVMGWGVIK